MPPIHLLIKPASSACNMRCGYCFYNAIAEQRETAFMGILPDDKLEEMIKSAFDYAEGYCGFAFQGGEPTLAGLAFFRRAVALQKKYNTKSIAVSNAIQTNGYVIDEEWAIFLKENNFLVGLSLDGSAELHNANRLDKQGRGTFNRILSAARLLEKQGVEFNILSVVTGKNARSIEKIYNFFKKNGFRYLQFIPCLEPLEKERGSMVYHLSTKAYGDFLKRIFDLWYQDFMAGSYVSIRHIDNFMSIALGREPEACNMRGHCTVQFVVEGDGSVYPCDFYVFDGYSLGKMGESSLQEMQEGAVAQRFLESSRILPEDCKTCPVAPLCRNGCARDRVEGKNYYCAAYKEFYTYALPNIKKAAAKIRSQQQ